MRGMTAGDMARARRLLMRRDPVLAPIIRKHGACGIKTGRETDIFCGLVEAIVSQQLSTRAAATIYGRLRALMPDGGTPTPEALLPLTDEVLRGVGLSRQKTGYLRDLSRKVLDGTVNTDGLSALSDEEIIAELTKIKGIGRWTVEMILIFRLARPDILPVGDLGIVKAIQKAYGLRKAPDVTRMQRIAEPWRPYRSVASWYLWASLVVGEKEKGRRKKEKGKGMKTTLACLAALTAAVLTLGAQAPATEIPRIDIEKYTLPNGLEVILSEDRRLPIVGVDLWYHVGPAHEAPGRTGFAHLFEHMMFQGSKHVPGDGHFRLLEGAGGTGLNGTTNYDRTNYFETVPTHQLELALWLESDRMGFLLETVDQAKLSNQQDVVRNERRQSVENAPYGVVQEAFTQALYPAGHPYHGRVIGSHADIQAARLEDVRQFFREYYAPNNATLAIAGDIDKPATKKLIEKYFGSLKRGPAVPPVNVKTPPITSERRLVVQDRVELPRVYMGWITPAIFKDGDAEADIAASVLGDGRSSRLYKKLVYERQIAQSVTANQSSLSLGSTFAINATARPGHTLQELEAAIDEELALMRKDGPTPAEVDRVRNVLETRTLSGLQRRGGFGGVADQLNLYNHFLGTPDYLAQDIMRRRKVTPDSVRAFAQQYLQPNARVVVHGVPGKQDVGPEVPKPAAQQDAAGSGGEGVNAEEPWRATAPKPSNARAPMLPTPQSFQLANGLTVLFSPQTGLPLVSASLVVRNGGDANPIDKPGLASFSAAMLNQGTSTRSATQLAEDVAQLGASLTTGSTMDSSTVTVSSLSRNFPAALSLLADVALRSTFPAEEVDRIRASRLADVVQQRSNPNIIANNVMAAALYGLEHPYGFAQLGTADSIKRVTRDDLESFWRRQFVPGNTALVIAGSIAQPELRKLVESAFGSWPRGTAAAPTLGESALAQPRLVLVDRPGSQQTQLRVATIGVPRSSPDYIRLRVMNSILGGLFSSRINLNLREANGYTYGAGSQFSFWRGAGPFAVSTGVRTDVTAPAVREIVNEVKRMVATDVTADELTLAKDAITQSLPGQFETNESMVGALSSIFVYGLPLNYYSALPAQIDAVTAKDVHSVAAKYLVPEKMVVVAVGDSARIREPLEAQVAPAELRNLDGMLLPK